MARVDEEMRARWEAARAIINARMANSQSIPLSRIRAALETPRQFDTWLRQQSPEARVGDTVTPDDCPIANYLWDILAIYVWVGETIQYKRKRVASVPYPTWVGTLLAEANDWVHSRGAGSLDISADELLSILHGSNLEV
jgi:hypothetical protein